MNNVPLEGKTYSLQDSGGSSDAYYERVGQLANDLLQEDRLLPDLFSTVRRLSRNKRELRNLSAIPGVTSVKSVLVHTLDKRFSRYTVNAASHVQNLSYLQRWSKTLSTNEQQYHLYMLEIELVNRTYALSFRKSTARLAFLPHCLHDLNADCHKTIRGDDYVCKGCSKDCTINSVSKALRRHGVKPYIWMTANLQALFKRLRREGESIGILGIACIPELVNGMHMCIRAGIPVVGIPLDANRCARWWGEFHPNSVNLAALENLLGSETLLKPLKSKAGTSC